MVSRMSNDLIKIEKNKAGLPTVTSLQVAEKFGKRHDHVLRAIREAECSPEFAAPNFGGGFYKDGNGQDRPMFNITRDGFVFLAMGFTGKEAAYWKEQFIKAFNSMESTLIAVQSDHERWVQDMIDRQQRVIEALGGSHAITQLTVGRVEEKVEDLASRVTVLETRKPRRDIPGTVKENHRYVLKRLGGRCPCCMQEAVSFEFDHFFSNQNADFKHSWPLCSPCHSSLTRGVKGRAEVRSRFDAYQERATELFHVQLPLIP